MTKQKRGLQRHLAVRTHLILHFITATVLIGALVGASASSSFQSARQAAASSVKSEATWQAQDMESAVLEVSPQLRAVVALPDVHSVNSAQCSSALQNFAALAGGLHVLIIKRDGTIVCSDGSMGGIRAIKDPAMLADIFDQHRVTGGPLTDPTIDKQDLWYAETFRAPSKGRVALVGMGPVASMAAMSKPDAVEAYLASTTTRQIFSAPSPTSSLLGTTVDSSTLQDLLAGGRTLTVDGGDGVRRILAAEPIPNTSWVVIAGLPYDQAIAPARHDLYRNLLVGGLIVLVLLALAFLLHRRISKPLRRLRRAMEQVDEDHLSARAPVCGPVEFRELAGAFNEMLDARARGEARFRALARYDSDFVTIVDADGVITYANPRAAEAFGLDPADPEPTRFADLVESYDRPHVTRLMGGWMLAPAGTDKSAEFRLVTRTEEVREVEAVVQNLLDDSAVSGLIITCNDITERKAAEDRLTHAALHDSLTGLPNRPLIMDRLAHVLERSRRDNTLSAVLFLDLDNFKLINDTAGHSAGDALLVQVAERLSGLLRPGDTLGRCGGDEFVVICESLNSVEDAELIAARLIETRDEPYLLGGHEVYTGISIGIAIAGPQDDPSGLLRDADSAMYAAKSAGRGTARVFDDAMRVATNTRLDLENALQRAIDRNELSLHYQPLIALDDNRPIAFEALLRWTMSDGSMIRPDHFIPIAEESGLIVSIGKWVLDEGCRQLADWTASQVVPADASLAVNVSARQLAHPSFPATVASAVDRYGLDAGRIVLELTESAVMQDAVSSLATLTELRALGVRIAVDDFGTGYSSLGYLERLPIDELKIDRSFVSPLSTGTRTISIVESIVTLGHALGLTVTAEGVETLEQLDSVRRVGCDLAQGFLLAKPMPPAQVREWMATDWATAAQAQPQLRPRPVRRARSGRAGRKPTTALRHAQPSEEGDRR